MHAIGSWSGQVFAVASSNDAGGKKTRIRRSKEERKGMVESFIKKYQTTNEGHFPSLNLTHKEVGGSFYTVREIVREIIQENRVLAPPKGSVEEYDQSGFLEQHILGPLSTEPQSDFLMSDGENVILNGSPITATEQFSNSNLQFHAPDSLELGDKHILNGVVDGESSPAHDYYQHAKKEEDMNSSYQFNQSKDEIIVHGDEDFEQNPSSDELLVTTIAPSNHQVSDNHDLLSSQNIEEQETQIDIYEQKFANETKEFVQQTSDSLVTETVHGDIDGSNTIEAVQHVISDVVVETFPLRPVTSTPVHTDGLSATLHETASILADNATEDDNKHLNSSLKLLTETEDDKVVVNCHELSLETSKVSITSEQTLLDTDDVKDSMLDETKVGSSSEQLASEVSTVVGKKFSDKHDSSLPEGTSSTLDRINLETWQGASKSSARRETNPVLAVVKAFISAFVKFWTE